MDMPAHYFVCCDSAWSILGMPHLSAVRSLLSLVRYNTGLDQFSLRRDYSGIPVSSVFLISPAWFFVAAHYNVLFKRSRIIGYLLLCFAFLLAIYNLMRITGMIACVV